MLRILFLLALLASSTVEAATITTKTTVANTGWTDLGAGPMLLSFRGSGVYAISDATPALVAEGFSLSPGDSVALNTTSHVWAMASGAPNVDAYVAPISASGGSGGGGITSITAGTTPTSGFTAGQLMMSDGTLVQAAGNAQTTGNIGASYFNAVSGTYLLGSWGAIDAGTNGVALHPSSVDTERFVVNDATHATAFRVYNTYTDINNGEWGALDWQTTPNVLTIGTQKNGTGSARNLQWVSGGTAILDYGVNIASAFTVSGGVVPGINNWYTFGTPTKAWDTIYARAYFAGATAGVTCSGAPTASFAVTNGIVTHC